ncbi:unnamed protein product [Parajaminaea phylloscopi]
MPKFNPRQQQKKLRRHNPVARTESSSRSAASADDARVSKASSDAVPILACLPLQRPSPDSQTSLQEDEQVHRALLGINSLLLSKSSRAALLNPRHKLLVRLTNLLDHPRLEVRKEAAGCLRNLCVEGQWSIREQLWQLGGGVAALAQVKYAAEELGLLPKEGQADGAASDANSRGATTVQKKPEDMNRKERRHAAKAAKAAGGKEADGLDTAVAPVNATHASALAEIEAHELLLLHLSLLENHLTILWCLLEGVDSPVWVTTLNRSIIGSLLTRCIASGAQAVAAPLAGGKIAQREEGQVRAAKVEMSLTAGNLLAAWLEDNAAAAASVAGLPLDLVEQVAAFEQAGNSSLPGTKSRARLEAILERLGHIDPKKGREARDKIEALVRSVETLLPPVATSTTTEKATATATLQSEKLTLGLLSLASTSNLAASLPFALRSWVSVPDSTMTLSQWHTAEAAPRLITLTSTKAAEPTFWEAVREAQTKQVTKERRDLAEASGMDVDVEGDDDADEEALRPSLALRALDDLQLAVELLGEICTAVDDEDVTLAPQVDSGTSTSAEMEHEEAMSDVGSGDGDEDSLDTDQEAEMLALADADRADEVDGPDVDTDAHGDLSMSGAIDQGKPQRSRKDAGDSAWSSSLYAQLITKHNMPGHLLSVAKSAAASVGSDAPLAAHSEDFVLATQSTLASLLSGLAAHAKPPPSHPLESGSREARKVDQFQRWVQSASDEWSALWSALKVWASVGDEQTSDALKVPVWTSLHALLVMHEGAGPLPFDVTPEELKSLFGSTLDVALARSANLTATSAPQDVEAAGYASTTASLVVSSLAYLARSAPASPTAASLEERNRFASDLWLTLLSSAPTVSAAVVTSTLNSLVDTYADETAPWDQTVFQAGNILARLGQGAVVAKVRARARTVDKRRQADVREALDEAVENLVAFIEYRNSLL